MKRRLRLQTFLTVTTLFGRVAPDAFTAGGRPTWQLHLRDGAGGSLHLDGCEVTKPNGVGTLDLAWSRTFTVESNRNCHLPCRSCSAKLAMPTNSSLLRIANP